MRLPSGKKIGEFAADLIDQCTASRKERLQAGAVYKNVYLTGSDEGTPQTYLKTFAFIDNLSSFLYSPVDLRFTVQKDGQGNKVDHAMGRAAGTLVTRKIRRADIDTKIEDAITWALVKGKTFVKMLPERGNLKGYLIQPELMGVLREDLETLDEQEAFVHSTYITTDEFARVVRGNPQERKLMERVKQYVNPQRNDDDIDQANALKQIILGGLNPYQQAGQGGTKSKGVVNWLDGPRPQFDAKVLAKIVRLDELWVWDDAFDDWTTIQIVGPDCVVEGAGDVRRNLLASDPQNPKARSRDNPLFGKHPFHEFCPNRLSGYFWGRSEIQNVALLQKTLNARIDGINMMLRKEENPARIFIGGSSVNQTAYAKLNKPGGYLSDTNPNTKIETFTQAVPPDVWQSLHEIEQMFNDMAGFPPVLQGKGESGVRAQGHAETLTRNAAPRFKDRALLVERDVEGLGGGALDILKAKSEEKLHCWLPKEAAGPYGEVASGLELEPPPAKGYVAVGFLLDNLDDDMRVGVDAHSGSPAFLGETRSLIFDLAKVGAINGNYMLEHLGAPSPEQAITDLEEKNANEAELLRIHPELMQQHAGKKK